MNLKDLEKLVKKPRVSVYRNVGRPYYTPSEQDLEAFAAWWRGEKSQGDLAKELRCTRVTVFNRFKRIKAMLGLSNHGEV